MGMTSTSTTNCISTVSRTGDTQLNFVLNSSTLNKVISEHYKLAWTAYAIVPIQHNTPNTPCPANDEVCDLHLYYNFRPWENDRLNLGTTPHRLLMNNVSVFKFAELGSTLRFKICARERLTEDQNITICKEKAVIR